MGIHYSQHTEEFKLNVVKKYRDEGFTSPTRLAKLVGVSEATIRCWLKRYGEGETQITSPSGLVRIENKRTIREESSILVAPVQEIRMSWKDVVFSFPPEMDMTAIAKLSILLSERSL